MGSVYARGRKLWIKYKDADGRWMSRPSSFAVGQEKDAHRLLERIEERVCAGSDVGSALLGPLTLERYAQQWIEERRLRGLANVVEDDSRLRLHVLPELGAMILSEIRPRHVRDLLRKLQAPEQSRAPRTVRHIYATLRKLCNDAVVDEVIDSSPCKIKRGDLPKNVDKDPAWRETAVFSREEIETLISDPRIPQFRRVYYAMQALAGPRVSSGLARRWKHYDTQAKPLGKLAVVTKYSTRRKAEEPGTKSGASIYVPVHPTLARMLAEWKLSG